MSGAEASAPAAGGSTRRALLHGAAWAAPTLVVSAAAPAFAASPIPGLSGLMRLTYRSRNDGASVMELTTDDTGLGLRVEDSTTQPVNAFLTISLDDRVVASTANWGTNPGWTVTFQSSSGGFNIWRLACTGTWTRTGNTWTAATYTYVIPATGYVSSVRARVQRSVQVNGTTYTRDSGVIIIGASNRSSRRVEPAPSAPADGTTASDGGGAPTGGAPAPTEVVVQATA